MPLSSTVINKVPSPLRLGMKMEDLQGIVKQSKRVTDVRDVYRKAVTMEKVARISAKDRHAYFHQASLMRCFLAIKQLP